MKNPAEALICPKCHNSGMSFTTEQKGDGFTVSWTPCTCTNTLPVPLPIGHTPPPVFL